MAYPWADVVELVQNLGWVGLAIVAIWEAWGPFEILERIGLNDEQTPHNQEGGSNDEDLVDALRENAQALRDVNESIDAQTASIEALEELNQEMYRELLREVSS